MNQTNCLIVFGVGFLVASSILLIKNTNHIKVKMDVFTDTFMKQTEALDEHVKRTLPFEATGFKADALDDGRIKVVFLKRVAEKDDENKEDWAEFREVIMPAWMFAQVHSEAALKLGFEALKKKEKANEKANN